MAENKHHIDTHFKEGLKDLEVKAPDAVWTNIENQLDRKRKAGMITFWSALAAGIAVLIGIGLYLNNERATSQMPVNNKSLAITFPTKDKKKSVSNNPTETIKSNGVTAENKGNKDIIIQNSQQRVVVIDEANQQIHSKQEALQFSRLGIKENFTNETKENSRPSVAQQEQSVSLPKTYISSYASPITLQLNTNSGYRLILPEANAANPTPVMTILLPDEELANKDVTPKINKWSITGQVAPLYSYRTSNQATVVANEEKGLMAYSGGIKVDYKASKRFSIQVGVYYNAMGQTVDNIKVAAYQNNQLTAGTSANTVILFTNNSLGPVVNANSNSGAANLYYYGLNSDFNSVASSKYANSPSITNTEKSGAISTHDGSMEQKFNFIEVPVLARFKLIDKKIGVHMIGGLSTNFLVNNYVIFKQDGNSENIGHTEGLNTVNYSTTIGLGINYELFKKIDLSVEPTYKYYIKSISSNKNVDFRPFSFGVFTGLVYKF